MQFASTTRVSLALLWVHTCIAAVATSAGAQSTLPSPWTASDIGSPAIAGSSSHSGGTFRMDAAGTDIWGTSDQFHFVYQAVTGDVEIVARVDSLTATNPWSKTGVMIRSALTANAAHGYAVVSGANGSSFQRRLSVGGQSALTAGATAGAPLWVRLVREGTNITAYRSTGGTSWTLIGSDTVALGATAYVGLATTSHNASLTTSANVSQVSVQSLGQAPLPSPQQAQDIGGPARAGATSYSGGTYTITAGGADIWGTADEFHFVYQPVSGDVDVVARIASLVNTNGWAKAGVMIRENLTAGSRNAIALVTPGNGYTFQQRIDANGYTDYVPGGAGSAAGWVRLKRTGDQFEAFRSADGTNWTSMGTDTVPMAAAVYVGLAVTSHNTATATTAVIDGLRVTAGTPQNQAPTVTLTSPANGASYTAPATIPMTAGASDADGSIVRVDFFRGGVLVASDTAAPFAASASSVPAGTYALTAVALDTGGASATSAAVTVSVNAPANQPPTVTLTSPANGGTYTAPATVALAATASDPEGALVRVDFYNGATLLNSDTTAPYAFSWTNVPAGAHTLTARAYDAAGGTATSSGATITVTTATSGPTSAYGLDQGSGTTAVDNTGNGANGVITGATWVSGRYGRALNFDGNDGVAFGDADRSGPFTVMGWLQTRSLYSGTCGSFVMKRLDYGFELCAGQFMARVGSGTAWNATAAQTWTSADLNVWKHVAMTYDGSTVRLYVGGVLITSGSGAHGSSNNPLLFGQWTSTSEFWNGLIDEVRIYTRALTQGEIQADMNTPISGGSGNQPPTAALTSPANGATYTAPATIAMSATASDADGTIARVDFFRGSTLVASDTTAPYSVSASAVPAGTHSLTAVAVDNAGASTTSATVTVTVNAPGNQPPTAALTSPASGATFTALATISIAASASDPEGQLTRVEFYNGTTLLATDTTAPYSWTWPSVSAGTYSLTAKAFDAQGANATSAARTITVNPAGTPPPTTVVFTASPDHASLTSYRLEVFASGANPNTATPVATSGLGKPTPAANNDITVDRAAFFSALVPGNYIATVSAIGAGGSSRSAAVAFTR